MCGIAGILYRDPSAPVARDLVELMCDRMIHRGPDDWGVFVSGPVGLGMRRLSIIDIAGGHQPMHTADGRLTVVFNGEIYNHREVRRELEGRGYRFRTASDTEVILHAYDELGPDCLQHLNGMFAIAIWDARARELFLARDRLGIKPLYVCDDGNVIRFASEIKAILADPSVPRVLDERAFGYFLRYGYVGAPPTLFRHIRQVMPAEYLLVGARKTTVRRYWHVDYRQDFQSTEEDHAERVTEALQRAVERQLISDVPLGAFLSGGLDSASLVSLMSDITHAPVNTYSIGFQGPDRYHNELDDARLVAERFGTRHHEILVRPDVASLIPKLVHHLDQPLADSSFIVTYLVSSLARETVKVIISGVGGDEIFGGYRRYLGPRLDRFYDRMPPRLRRVVAAAAGRLPVDRGSMFRNYSRLGRAYITSHGLAPFERYDRAVEMLSSERAWSLSPRNPSGESDLVAARRSYFDALNGNDVVTRMMHLDVRTSLPDSLLMLTDKMSMATSLEARVPLLDHQLVELAARIPGRLHVRGTRLRHLQKLAMQAHLPSEVLSKRKRGFGCPVGAWFRNDLRPLLRDTLAPDRLRRQGLLAPGFVEAVIGEHEGAECDHSDLLLALLTFQLWHDQWMGAGAAGALGRWGDEVRIVARAGLSR